MEVLLSQRLEYYTIAPLKNYSNYPQKEDDKFSITTPSRSFRSIRTSLTIPLIVDFRQPTKPEKGRITKYFYGDEQYKNVQLGTTTRPKLYVTTNERHLKQHFGNPFSKVAITLIERSIVRRGDKIVLKLYERTKTREVNCKYYRKRTNIVGISFDIKTGHFTISELSTSKIRKKKKFRKNHFPLLLEIINRSGGLFQTTTGGVSSSIYPEFCEVFDTNEFITKCYEYLGMTMKNPLFYDFMDYFIEKRKLKMPDDFRGLFLYYYPTERYFKKNDRKFIASLLDRVGIKSKTTIKLLHNRPNIDLNGLVELCYLLGDDYPKYIGNVNPDVFDDVKYKTTHMDYLKCGHIYEWDGRECATYHISKSEKDNILSIINNTLVLEDSKDVSSGSTFLKDIIYEFRDHFRQLEVIQKEFPNYKLFARTYQNFREEHTTYSKIYNLMRKEYFKKYIYDQYTIDSIQEPIVINDDEIYYPHLLTREDEYIEEGQFMNHCVASYARSEGSMIVSLRTKDGSARVTNEYIIRNGNRQQSQGLKNTTPTENFIKPLKKLSDRIIDLHKENKLKWVSTEQVKVKLQLNDNVIENGVTEHRYVPEVFEIEEFEMEIE